MEAYRTTQVSRRYNLERPKLRQIVDKMRMSTRTVSRILAHARNCGVADIGIRDEHPDVSDLEVLPAKRFSLNECLIVPNFDTDSAGYGRMADARGEVLSRRVRGEGF